ncbi:MAG: hypothetical protein QOE36_1360 [Gaiellaceae bacterium]|nr:hypothetical protein [Gaiellaceae bacterium]
MKLRPATEADFPAEYEIFRAAIGDLFRRHAFEPPNPPPEAFAAQLAHLLAHDAPRCFVAEDGGRVVAFAAALVRGDAWFLSSLFVEPGHQRGGVGRALLEATWGGGYRLRLTMTDSIQPASNGLYARRGLVPATPVLALAGTPAAGTHPPGLEAAAGSASPDILAELDRAAYGFDRAPDHVYWARLARRTVWLRDGEAVAYSYLWPQGGRIGPVAGLDGEAAGLAVRAELARRAPLPSSLLVPGSARECVKAALEAGLRLVGPPGLLLVSDDVVAPRSLCAGGFALL